MNFKRYHVSRNLYNKDATDTNNGFVDSGYLYNNGGVSTSSQYFVSEYIPIQPNTDYTLVYADNAVNAPSVCFYDSSKSFISGEKYDGRNPVTFTTPNETAYIRFSGVDNKKSITMLNTGSTALPYEPYGNAWNNAPHYIHNTATDTITTLPAVLYPTGTTATVGLKGNEQHTGTPSPTSPIMPQGTGERTGNLADLYNVDKTQVSLRVTTGNNMKVVVNGTKGSGNNVISIKVPNITVPAGVYTVKIKMTSGSITGLTSDGVFFGINASTYGQRTAPAVTQIGEVGTRTFTLSEDTTITSFDITPSYGSSGAVFDNATFECWFYAGSDNKPYEPYGYKIPISSANTTTPVYLGEVETTRMVKKLVLTGEELFTINASGNNTYFAHTLIKPSIRTQVEICTHLTYATITASNTNVGFSIIANGTELRIRIPNAATTSLADFKSYLATQYAAGTPVTVWYVLANEETGIVNEPLRKIGGYADEVSGITIPTTAGANTLSIGTALQPSEVTVNYKGWHPVQSVHERDSGAWT